MEDCSIPNLGRLFLLTPPSCDCTHLPTPWTSKLGRKREVGDQTEEMLTPQICERKDVLTFSKIWNFWLLHVFCFFVLSFCLFFSLLRWKGWSRRVKGNCPRFHPMGKEVVTRVDLTNLPEKRLNLCVLWSCLLSTSSTLAFKVLHSLASLFSISSSLVGGSSSLCSIL